MPISSDQFDRLSENREPTPGTNADRILEFLRANPDTAFTRSEISEATDVKRGSVGPTLVRLRERGRVDHRGNYWRVSDQEQATEAAASHASKTAASHEQESPSYEAWQTYAVDPRDSEQSSGVE